MRVLCVLLNIFFVGPIPPNGGSLSLCIFFIFLLKSRSFDANTNGVLLKSVRPINMQSTTHDNAVEEETNE